MYLNFGLYKLQPQDLYYLIAVKQTEKEVLKTIPLDTLQRFTDNNLIMYVKGTNKEEGCLKIRLNANGKKLLDNLETPDVLEEHVRMGDYLIKMYLSHQDEERVVGNKKLIVQYIAVLQNHLNIDIYQLYYLFEFFLAEHIFTKKLENVFLDRNKNRYGEFKNNVEDSPIFQFYEKRKQEVEQYWAKKIKTEK